MPSRMFPTTLDTLVKVSDTSRHTGYTCIYQDAGDADSAYDENSVPGHVYIVFGQKCKVADAGPHSI